MEGRAATLRRERAVIVGLASVVVLLGVGAIGPAAAFDFFGLWPGAEAPPSVSKNSIPYSLTFKVEGGDSGLTSALRDASTLYGLRLDAPPDGDSLARRAARDFAPLVDALWASGYYNASVVISIDGIGLKVGGDAAAFARAAESYRNHAPAPVVVSVKPGPLFALRSIAVVGPNGRAALAPSELPQRVIGLKPGDPAVARKLRAAQARMIDYFRAQSRPLAKVVAVRPVIDHPAHAMDLTIVLDPGPSARIGKVTVVGPKTFAPSIARSFIYLEQGDPYSPQSLEKAKTSVRTIPAVGSVRVVESTKIDAAGDLPIEFDVGARLRHAIGASAQYSTIDGPTGQIFWEDRNLFGGAEFLRLEAAALYAPSTLGPVQSVGGLSDFNLGGRLAAHFLKPALWGSRNDLLLDATAERVSTSYGSYVGYTADDVDVSAAVRHRFSQQLSVQAGLEAQKGFATDILGTVNYTLVGTPVSLLYDTTDDKLDPKRGVRASATIAAYPTFLGSSLGLMTARVRASTYYSLDEDSRYVLAGRVDLGGITGASLSAIPANWRLYAGGGGSVRGYQYDSLGPMGPGNSVIGGRSVFDASLELRVRLTDSIGLVPFFDAGNAFASSAPDFSQPLRMAAGLGLRYYTSFGPIRLDVAAPINRRPGDSPVAIYVSIGQSF